MENTSRPHEGPGWLVFGLSGQVGDALRAAWRDSDPRIVAVSRHGHADAPRLRWLRGRLEEIAPPPDAIAAVASLGPLDAFSHWYQAQGPSGVRVVALGSTSVHSKPGSPDPAERALARTLAEAEARLAQACAERGCPLTLLRPTLVWGNGRDRNLSRLVALARRWRWLPLPTRAAGLRQPVHVDDVAAAVLAALRSPRPVAGHFDLPGGEALPFDTMVGRALAAGAPGARLLRLPGPLFRTGVRILRHSGRLAASGEGVLARLDQDLWVDPEPARRALALQPRGFQPGPEMFPG
ncbi:NAD-dependent epimerase/dehydratase family protein [Arenimonas sp. MALMAid1274]|uniref:NAD-dependent epimerase/dehydratase family protein n=1 Tax=Arenimonas sp. MALMAid1274 TaxID=3411630 RepID=UPI003B9FE82F